MKEIVSGEFVVIRDGMENKTFTKKKSLSLSKNINWNWYWFETFTFYALKTPFQTPAP